MAACPACRTENPGKARYCLHCGERLPRAASAPRVRRRVTVLFTDVVDSTALGRHLDLERLHRVLERFFEEARQVLGRHGGVVQKYVGDAVMAVFGLPRFHTDDALRAVRAAVELHTAMHALNHELRRDWGVELTLHTAMSTGYVMVEEGETRELGVAAEHINVAAELIKLAGADAILIANSTYQLVRGAVRVEPVHDPTLDADGPVFTVLEFSEQAPHRLMTPMIDRQWELDFLRLWYEGALLRRCCLLVSILGPPGIGKTRLVEELVWGLSRRQDLSERPQVLRGLCLRPEADSTYYPIRQMLRQVAGIRADAPVGEAMRQLARLVDGNQSLMARLAPFIGLPGGQAAEPEDTIRAICRAMAIAGRRAPLVLIVDDLHWAERPMLDILERVKDWLTDVPVLIIAVSRDEFFDEGRDWTGWMRNTASVTLSPLSRSETEQMIGQILRGGQPDQEIVAGIVAETGGSPLDTEELLVNLLDDGAVRLEEGRWVLTGDPDRLRNLVQGGAAFAARIDRLDEVERHVIVRGAVVGLQFRAADIEALLPEYDLHTVTATLGWLVRKELLKPNPDAAGPFEPGDESYGFRHARYQQAAYDRLSMEDRAALHERYATWLQRSGDDSPATIERVAFHLDRSYRCQAALRGEKAERATELARQAGEWYARAGRAYITKGAFPVPYAERALTCAMRLLPDRSPEQLRARLDLADTLQEPRPARAREIYWEVSQAAHEIGDSLIEHHAKFGRLELDWFLEGTDASKVETEIAEFMVAGVQPGPHLRAKAYRLLAHAQWSSGKISASLRSIDCALELITQTGDARLRAKIVSAKCVIMFWGRDPLETVVREIEQAVGWARGEGLFSLEATGLSLLARAAAMQGDFERARLRNREARQTGRSRSDLLIYALDTISGAMVERSASNLEQAEQILRAGGESLEKRGVAIARSTVAGMLARVLLCRGADAEAEEYVTLCRQSATASQVDGQLKWRQLRALLLARRGELAEAEALAREAVALSDETEQPLSQAEANGDLAEVLRIAGKFDEARATVERANTLYRLKGHMVAAREMEQLRDRLPVRS